MIIIQVEQLKPSTCKQRDFLYYFIIIIVVVVVVVVVVTTRVWSRVSPVLEMDDIAFMVYLCNSALPICYSL